MEDIFEKISGLKRTGKSAALWIVTKTPIGLDIGGETPEETAISISAEIIAVKKGKNRSL